MKTFVKNGFTLYNGDFKKAVIGERGKIDLIVTSPPYNISSKSPKKVGGRRLGGFDAKNFEGIVGYDDNLPEEEYRQSQHDFLVWCSEMIKPDGVIVYNHKNVHRNGRLLKPERLFPSEDVLIQHDEITWDRGSTHNHCPSFVYPQSEKIFVFKKPESKIHFKNRGFIWEGGRTAGVGDVWRKHFHQDNDHNAPFPLDLIRQAIVLWSRPGDLVCDPYSGSGTTMIASMIEGRRFVGSEILENYWKMACGRFERASAKVKMEVVG